MAADRAEAEEHTFRDKEGRELRGEIVAVEGATAKIKRSDNSAVVEVPISRLSTDDKNFLLDWLQKEQTASQQSEALPAGWARLRIEVPLGFDEVHSTSLTRAFQRIAGRVHEGIIPVGSWVALVIDRNDPEQGDFPTLLLRFNGERNWKLSLDGKKVLRSTDSNSTPEIVAIDVPEADGAVFLEALRTGNLAERISFRVNNLAGLQAVSGFGHPVAGLMLDNTRYFDRSIMRPSKGKAKEYLPAGTPLLGLDPQALFLEGGDEILALAATLPSLQHLTLYETKDARWSFEAFQKLRALPGLKSMWILSEEYPETEFVKDFGNLRSLKINGSGHIRSPGHVRDPLLFPPLASLQALSVNSPIQFDTRSLQNLPTLKYLQARGFESGDDVPADLISVYWSDKDPDYAADLDRGKYRNVRSLLAVKNADYGKMPLLENLEIFFVTTDLDSLERSKNLRSLGISEIQQSELERIASMPNLKNLEGLSISRGKLSDLSPLANLPKLKRIEISELSESPLTVDLSKFSTLEDFSITRIHQMEGITGIGSHPKLTRLRLTTAPALISLGEVAENAVLESVYLSGLDQLQDISSLTQTTALKSLDIYKCPKLTEPLLIDESNDLEYIRVWRSEGLNERPPPAPEP